MQGQVLYLSECAGASRPPGSAQLGSSVLAVHLTDDLCGRVRVGDRVLATGWGQYYGGSAALMTPQAHLPLMLGVQVKWSWVMGAGGLAWGSELSSNQQAVGIWC